MVEGGFSCLRVGKAVLKGKGVDIGQVEGRGRCAINDSKSRGQLYFKRSFRERQNVLAVMNAFELIAPLPGILTQNGALNRHVQIQNPFPRG